MSINIQLKVEGLSKVNYKTYMRLLNMNIKKIRMAAKRRKQEQGELKDEPIKTMFVWIYDHQYSDKKNYNGKLPFMLLGDIEKYPKWNNIATDKNFPEVSTGEAVFKLEEGEDGLDLMEFTIREGNRGGKKRVTNKHQEMFKALMKGLKIEWRLVEGREAIREQLQEESGMSIEQVALKRKKEKAAAQALAAALGQEIQEGAAKVAEEVRNVREAAPEEVIKRIKERFKSDGETVFLRNELSEMEETIEGLGRLEKLYEEESRQHRGESVLLKNIKLREQYEEAKSMKKMWMKTYVVARLKVKSLSHIIAENHEGTTLNPEDNVDAQKIEAMQDSLTESIDFASLNGYKGNDEVWPLYKKAIFHGHVKWGPGLGSDQIEKIYEFIGGDTSLL